MDASTLTQRDLNRHVDLRTILNTRFDSYYTTIQHCSLGTGKVDLPTGTEVKHSLALLIVPAPFN